jgi:hypothetical protein
MRLTPPEPETGWSRDIITLRDAVIVPPKGAGLARVCGVLDAQGQPVLHAQSWRENRNLTPPPHLPEIAPILLPGRHLFMGQLWHHFGHFLTESLMRIWGIEQAGDVRTLLYTARQITRANNNGLTHPPPYVHETELLGLLDVAVPLRTVNRPLIVEELVVPGQGFGLGAISAGTPEFRAFIARRLAPDVKPIDTGSKIYISRSALVREARGLFGEHYIEANLEAEGYRIFRPETETLADQIATYRGASVILGLEGSPFHLLGLVARPEQKVGIIRRRHSENAAHMVNQFVGFTGRAPVVIDVLTGEWISQNRRAAGRFHLGELDFGDLRTKLLETGFISGTGSWGSPDAQALVDERARFERLTGEALVPLPKGVSASFYRRRLAVQKSDQSKSKFS